MSKKTHPETLPPPTEPTEPLDGRECLPERMVAHFEASLSRPEQLDSAFDIALLEARRNDLLRRVDTGESGELFRSLRETYAAAEKALIKWNRHGDTVDGVKAKVEFFQCHETIGTLIAEGAADYTAWAEVVHVIQRRRELVETEMRHQEKGDDHLSAEQGAFLMTAMMEIIKQNVNDRAILAKITQQIGQIPVGPGG